MDKLQNKTVLVVDDEERNTFALKSYLETIGMKIRSATNGEETISLLRTGDHPDMILLDMMMPVMDGFETLAALKEEGLLHAIPVIAVTARAMKGDREKCLDAGAWDYVSKPIDLALLIDKMKKWII